eukprot:1137164-Pelagomonas_calceolata.AAC.5
MQKISGSRNYTSVLPYHVQKSREQLYFGNGERGHVRYVHGMLYASILGATGHECTAKFKKQQPPLRKDKACCHPDSRRKTYQKTVHGERQLVKKLSEEKGGREGGEGQRA